MSHETSDQTHCPDCALGDFKRNHYFTGKLLVERDFTDEQRFHIDKLRHHHQRLHGWGVVCGLKVKQHPSAQSDCLIIEPGTAIDCCGHEILVREEVPFHFSGAPALKALQALQPPDTASHTLQICIKYKECGTEQIPVLFDECGCDETRCAPNRILETWELDVLVVEPREFPEASEEDCAELLWQGLDSCPSCDTADCVVLATIENYHIGDKVEDQTDPPSKPEDDLTARIARIDNRTGRRLLPSTQVLTDVIQCLLDHPGGGGQGPPGTSVKSADAESVAPTAPADAKFDPATGNIHFKIPKGAAGQDGKSFEPLELPHIVAINWPHGKVISPTNLKNGLVIAFDRDVLTETINDESIQLFKRHEEAGEEQRFCYCNVEINVQALIVEAKCGDTAPAGKSTKAKRATGAGVTFQVRDGDYRVVVKGDFILGADAINIPGFANQKMNPALDANHIGPGLPDRCPTGDGIEGGTFESWFTIAGD